MEMPLDFQKKKIEERKQKAKEDANKSSNAGGSLSAALDLGGNSAAGSLAEALERQAAVQRRMSEQDPTGASLAGGTLSQMPVNIPQVQQSNPVEDLIAGLFNQVNS